MGTFIFQRRPKISPWAKLPAEKSIGLGCRARDIGRTCWTAVIPIMVSAKLATDGPTSSLNPERASWIIRQFERIETATAPLIICWHGYYPSDGFGSGADPGDERGHLFGAIVASLQDYRSAKATGKYAEYYLASRSLR